MSSEAGNQRNLFPTSVIPHLNHSSYGLLRPTKCPGIGSWYCWSIKEKTSHLLLLCFPAVVMKSCSCVICGFIPVWPVAHVYESRPTRWHILEHWAGVIVSNYEIFFFFRFWFLHKAKGGNRYQLTCKTFPALTFFSWKRSAALGAVCDYDFVSIVHWTAQPNKENLGMCFFKNDCMRFVNEHI